MRWIYIKCIYASRACVCLRLNVRACVRASAERKLNLETRCGNAAFRVTVVVVVEKLRGGWEPASSQNTHTHSHTHTQSAGDPLSDTHSHPTIHQQTPALVQYNQSLYNNNNTLSTVPPSPPSSHRSDDVDDTARWPPKSLAMTRAERVRGWPAEGGRHTQILAHRSPGAPGSLCLNQICSDKTELG